MTQNANVPMQDQIFALSIRNALLFHAVNEGAAALQASQAFTYQTSWGRLRLTHAMNQVKVNRDSPILVTLQKQLVASLQGHPDARSIRINLSADEDVQMRNGLALSWGGGQGLFLIKPTPWSAGQISVALRLSDLYAVKYAALGQKGWQIAPMIRRGLWLVFWAVVLAALVLIERPLRLLAPARVIAAEPVVLTAPAEAKILQVLVEDAAEVRAGTPLVAFDTAEYEAALRAAEQQVLVDTSALAQARNSALTSAGLGSDLPTLEAELRLSEIELDWARERLTRLVLTAPQDGVLRLLEEENFAGRVVATGQPLMEIVDRAKVEVQVDVPLSDSVFLFDMARAELTLNNATADALPLSDPDLPFEPDADTRGGVSYPLIMQLNEDPPPPIGAEGYARIEGADRPLGYVLLRRPIDWLLLRLRP